MSGLSESIPTTAKLEVFIRLLTLVIKIAKYIPLIVLLFAGANLFLALLDFSTGNILFGILNSVLAAAGFNFYGQLLKRRKIHRYDYRYRGRHSRRTQANGNTIMKSAAVAD